MTHAYPPLVATLDAMGAMMELLAACTAEADGTGQGERSRTSRFVEARALRSRPEGARPVRG